MKNSTWGILVILGAILTAAPVFAGQMCRFQWAHPTTNEDGSPIDDLAETRLYVAPAPGAPAVLDSAVPYPQAELLRPCARGSVWYATSADQSGNESAPSNIVEARDLLKPAPPGALRFTVTIEVTP